MAISDQQPLYSGFHAKSTATEVLEGIDLSGKTAIVTGGYSGIGLETVRGLANAGASVIVPVRSVAKAEGNLQDLTGDIRMFPMDLADLSSVKGFAEKMLGDLGQLDLLINNAGIMACPLSRVGPGWESQFGICHMGHFTLTKALMPLLEKADAPRVVALSSTAHKITGIDWDDIQFEKRDYDKWQAYGQAKSANALFVNALSRRMKEFDGLAFSVHPGGIFTPLQRHLGKEEMIVLGWLGEDGEPSELTRQGFKTPEQGAATTLWAATSSLLDGKPGVYCEDGDIAAITDMDSPMARYRGANPHICDDEAAEQLWDVSDALLKKAEFYR